MSLENIKIGDMVVSRSGRYSRVTIKKVNKITEKSFVADGIRIDRKTGRQRGYQNVVWTMATSKDVSEYNEFVNRTKSIRKLSNYDWQSLGTEVLSRLCDIFDKKKENSYES